MGKFDNLNDSQLPDILRRLDRLERASPVNNTAIGRGGIEVYDGGVINISNPDPDEPEMEHPDSVIRTRPTKLKKI